MTLFCYKLQSSLNDAGNRRPLINSNSNSSTESLLRPSYGWPGQWPTLRQKNISFLEEKQPSAQRGSQLKWARLPDITFFIFCKVSCRINRKSNAEDDFGDNSALEQVDALLPLRPSNQRIYFFAPPPTISKNNKARVGYIH